MKSFRLISYESDGVTRSVTDIKEFSFDPDEDVARIRRKLRRELHDELDRMLDGDFGHEALLLEKG